MLGMKLQKLQEGTVSGINTVQIQYFEEIPVFISNSFSKDDQVTRIRIPVRFEA